MQGEGRGRGRWGEGDVAGYGYGYGYEEGNCRNYLMTAMLTGAVVLEM